MPSSSYSASACPDAGKEQNSHIIVVCQRMLRAVADKRVLVQWVRVKGHSNEEGNDMADKLAGYAQKGGAKNEHDDIAMIMDDRGHGPRSSRQLPHCVQYTCTKYTCIKYTCIVHCKNTDTTRPHEAD
eukprot:COSAG06_NODE_5745_length_3295_cov_2.365770_4_plen_127_part_01